MAGNGPVEMPVDPQMYQIDDRLHDALAVAAVNEAQDGQGRADALGAVPLTNEQFKDLGKNQGALLKALNRVALASEVMSEGSDYNSDEDERFSGANKNLTRIRRLLTELEVRQNSVDKKREQFQVTTYLSALRLSVNTPEEAQIYNLLFNAASNCAVNKKFLKELKQVVSMTEGLFYLCDKEDRDIARKRKVLKKRYREVMEEQFAKDFGGTSRKENADSDDESDLGSKKKRG